MPEKDVEITASDGTLQIKAERRTGDKTEGRGFLRHEQHYGSLVRTLPRPEGVSESDITAGYHNGILEIRIPVPEQPARRTPTKIPIGST
ncbi:Hsp20/alpha crystallin family protein [Pseudonocardia sp. H11422]|uniref:Hsp20/alpha crystallin family protein n=1 Tax=Pseudonocardia sp. H11422 TaxID=2835866 RepID=UPI001BDD00D3|nr:Hsp20/alpha crystallin family protein [Pseudonocardia sp. H11422]